VALATGLDDIVPAEHRIGVGGRKDGVRTVTIMALGYNFSAKARHLAMEGIEKRLGLVLVAASALLHHLRAEPDILDTHDRMRGMTVFAGRFFLLRIRGRVVRPVNTAAEFFLDAVMTCPTGRSDVV